MFLINILLFCFIVRINYAINTSYKSAATKIPKKLSENESCCP